MNHEGDFGPTSEGRSLDFRLTDDHRLLGETVERLVREQYGFEVRTGRDRLRGRLES